MAQWYMQAAGGVRFDWGVTGATMLAPACACLVVVDVLSFGTSVSVAVERGTQVYPHPSEDDSAQSRAQRVGAELAVGRGETTPARPWSLSPEALRQAPAPPRLVLPSPNGAAITLAASGAGLPTVVACLRNAGAVGGWLAARGYGAVDRPVAVIAAGERWPDGTLRPALEDALGAGAVISALAGGSRTTLSPEAAAVRAGYLYSGDVAAIVTSCASGRELLESGFAADVGIAVEVESSGAVPLLTDAAIIDGARTDPAQTDPAQTDPAQTDPAQTDPAQTDPAQTDPARTDPARTDRADVADG